jgi:cytochrome c-type biogenesis protein CcmE
MTDARRWVRRQRMLGNKFVRSVPFALALSVAGLAIATAVPSQAAAQATMSATKTGKIVKYLSSTSFSLSSGKTTYVVKTDAMTHVTVGSKGAKLTSVKRGATVTVKGALEMHTITATSVVEGM